MLIPSLMIGGNSTSASLSRRVNANSQLMSIQFCELFKLIKKGEC